jgi:hypothetical protein
MKLQAEVPDHIHRAAMVRAAQTSTTLGGVITKALCAELGIKDVPPTPKRGPQKA